MDQVRMEALLCFGGQARTQAELARLEQQGAADPEEAAVIEEEVGELWLGLPKMS